MYRTGRSRVSAMTQTPASGPFGPDTMPPMSSLSIATSGCCAYEVGKNTNEDKTMEAVRPVSRAGHLRAMRFGAQVSSLVVMMDPLAHVVSGFSRTAEVGNRSKSGVPFAFREAFARPAGPFRHPLLTGVATHATSEDLDDPHYGHNAPYHGMPSGHLPVRSYLAVGIAAWAAMALENASLYTSVREASRLRDDFLASLSHELRT